jgi:glycosyltransferase involved in cell wall biosynthesis
MVTQPISTRPRAVILVANPAAPYSRALRIARTLVAAGYRVEIAAVAADRLPEREPGDGWELRRYRASGIWSRRPGSSGGNAQARGPARPGAGSSARRLVRRVVDLGAAFRRWIFWPHSVRGWWATLERELEPADLYHACGSLTIAAALRVRGRARIGPAGRPAPVIYDAIDDVFESNNVLDMPRPLRAWHSRREARWAHASDAIITVNEALAERLATRWRLASAPAVVPNYPEIPDQAGDFGPAGAGLIRSELGLPPGSRVILFQGRLGPRLGLEAAAEAILLVPNAVLVLLGFGRWFELERARDREPHLLGRHFTVAARHPDELLAWIASADLALVPLPPVSINQRLSSPNKFWEALGAGTPVVVPAELTYMAGTVRARDLGIVAASCAANDLAQAISAGLERLAGDAGWRARIQATARADYSWPEAARRYRAVLAELA